MSALWDLSAFDPPVTGELGDITDAGPYLKPSFPLLLSLTMRHIPIPTSSNCREHLSSFWKVPMTCLMSHWAWKRAAPLLLPTVPSPRKSPSKRLFSSSLLHLFISLFLTVISRTVTPTVQYFFENLCAAWASHLGIPHLCIWMLQLKCPIYYSVTE